MALTPSTMLPLGTPMPAFNLPAANPGVDDAGVEMRSSESYSEAVATVVVFTCNHCPYAIDIEDRLVALANEMKAHGVQFVAISSNDVSYKPADSFDKMTERAAEKNFPFPYLYDESQDVAKAFDAACTPDFYLFDADRKLVYRGQLDDGRPGKQATTEHLRQAITQLINDGNVTVEQIPSIGCNIKWRDN